MTTKTNKKYIEEFDKLYNDLASQDFDGRVPQKLIEVFLLSTLDAVREENKKREIKILERLKLEVDVNICECGEKWKETDITDLINEAIKHLKSPITDREEGEKK